ncbi:probable proline--tRNA ligase, mitochondrial [Parasteatoda tepidariorum]|uniref:probable proline--tRNA ligase, mitochondrial n=1 Tax=Parasteatoda tepidariorum TaxID=114398 RepID=UPI001C7181C1|nr:probable proline--tRNA ligase, mitochondrial [Parasteatoda tepidariorum]
MIRYFSKPKLMSQMLCFPESIPKEKAALSSCKSLKLMLTKGLIKHVSPGTFVLMPLVVQSVEKLCCLIDSLMAKADGQKVLFPSLIPKKLMKISGRWNTIDSLFKLTDRSSIEHCLGPTHEEIAHHLLSKYCMSYKSLPLKLYQISSKFRDEMNPKLGLLRGREFLMKDMYAFDSSEETSQCTYEQMCKLYNELLSEHLNIEPIKVQASSGDIGGKKSHEFHFKSEIGEDEILFCPSCKTGINVEIVTDIGDGKCSDCDMPLQKCNALEVGHAFMLGTTYSEPFQVKFDSSENQSVNCFASCYGLGVTRILTACLENLSTSSDLRWPLSIAPFYLSIISPKKNSKEEHARPFSNHIADSLNNIDSLAGNIIIDDRTNLTIGKRVQECSELGIPYIIVVGKHALKDVPKFEIIDVYRNQTIFLSHKETMEMFKYNVLF